MKKANPPRAGKGSSRSSPQSSRSIPRPTWIWPSDRFASSVADMAVEEGMATVTHGPDEPAQRTPYSVVYARQDGKWLTASARDLPDDTPTPEEQLKQLQWMIGEWVDESPEALVMTSYRWTDNQCYILSEFKVQIGGRPVMTGTQRIGWDPLAKTIRSWVFDSEGGFGEGIWTREGNQWIVKRTGVTRDGKTASSTNIITQVSKDRMTWQSRDRIVGGEKTPDIEEIPDHPKTTPSQVTCRQPALVCLERRNTNEDELENDCGSCPGRRVVGGPGHGGPGWRRQPRRRRWPWGRRRPCWRRWPCWRRRRPCWRWWRPRRGWRRIPRRRRRAPVGRHRFTRLLSAPRTRVSTRRGRVSTRRIRVSRRMRI